MSQYKPYLVCELRDGEYRVRHNCDGELNFCAEDKVTGETARLIQLAIEEGKRQRSKEISELLAWGRNR